MMEKQGKHDGDIDKEILQELSGNNDNMERAAMLLGTSRETNAASVLLSEIQTLTLAILKLSEQLSNKENSSVKKSQTASKQLGENGTPAKPQCCSASTYLDAMQDGGPHAPCRSRSGRTFES